MQKKMMRSIVRIIIGLVFVVSAVAKLYPIEPFELVFIDLGVSNFMIAPFLARFVIVVELFLGLSIIFNFWLKKWVYTIGQASLVVFTIYLVFLLITQGNDGDCGCFGSWIPLNPLQSIAKNILLMAGLFFVNRHQNYVVNRFWWLPIVFAAIAVASPFSLNPVGLHNIQGTEVNEKIDFSDLPMLYKTNQKVDFSKGKKMVAFFTWTCPHCINASRKLVALNKQTNIEHLYFVIGSKKEAGLLEFFEKTKCDFPTIWMKDDTFFKYSGGKLPAIVYMEDGVIKKKWFGDLFDVDEMKDYF